MKEQEEYFDRKIAGRLENAGADAPLTWEEMSLLVNPSKSKWRGWLRGFFFTDLLLIGLIVYGALQSHQSYEGNQKNDIRQADPAQLASSFMNSSAEVLNDQPAVSGMVPDADTYQTSGNTDFATTNRTASIDDQSVVTDKTTGIIEGKRKNKQQPHAPAALAAQRMDPSAEKSISTVSDYVHHSTVAEKAPDGGSWKSKVTSSRKSAPAAMHNRKPADDHQNDHPIDRNVARKMAGGDVENEAITLVSGRMNESIRTMQVREYFPETRVRLVDSVIPSGKQGAQLQHEAPGPTLISVYGTGFLEKVNYTSLLAADEQLDFQRKVHGGMGFGMMLGYQMSERYSLHLGLEFTRRDISFDWTTTGVQTDRTIDSQYVQVVTPDSSYYSWDYDTTYSTSTVREKLGYSASVSVLTIPVVVHYAIVSGAWVWMPYAGVEYNSRTATRLIRKFDPNDQVSVNESNLKEVWNYFSLRGGIKLVRRLNANVDVFTGLDVRYHIPINRQNLKGGATYFQLGVILHR